MKNIKNKNRLLAVLNSLDDEFKNLTINEFLKSIEKEILKEKEEETEEEKLVINTYKPTFLKIYQKDDDWMGESIKVYKVEDVLFKELDINFNKLYQIIGEEISFSKINVFKKKLTRKENRAIFTHQDLKKFEIISEGEYLSFLEKYKKLDKEIKLIFKEK
jgi:hypothetical protein